MSNESRASEADRKMALSRAFRQPPHSSLPRPVLQQGETFIGLGLLVKSHVADESTNNEAFWSRL